MFGVHPEPRVFGALTGWKSAERSYLNPTIGPSECKGLHRDGARRVCPDCAACFGVDGCVAVNLEGHQPGPVAAATQTETADSTNAM